MEYWNGLDHFSGPEITSVTLKDVETTFVLEDISGKKKYGLTGEHAVHVCYSLSTFHYHGDFIYSQENKSISQGTCITATPPSCDNDLSHTKLKNDFLSIP